MNEEENEELDPIEKELREAQEQYDRENQEIYDEVTKGNEEIRRKKEGDQQLEIPGLFEARSGARIGAGLAFEVGANSILDFFSLVPGSQAAGSAVINAIAQGIRGGKFSFGEVLGSAAASQIPGLAQGKAITTAGKFGRAAATGAVSGGIEATSIAAVDEGRLPTAQELGLAVGAGGILGAGFQKVGDQMDPRVTGLFRDLRNRIQQGRQSSFDLAGSVGAAKRATGIGRSLVDPDGQGQLFTKAEQATFGYQRPQNITLAAFNALRDGKMLSNVMPISNAADITEFSRGFTSALTNPKFGIGNFIVTRNAAIGAFSEKYRQLSRSIARPNFLAPELDHTTPLKVTGNILFPGSTRKQIEEYVDILYDNGLYAGDDPLNLGLLPGEVHQVATNWVTVHLGRHGQLFLEKMQRLNLPKTKAGNFTHAAKKQMAALYAKEVKELKAKVSDAYKHFDQLYDYNTPGIGGLSDEGIDKFTEVMSLIDLDSPTTLKSIKDIAEGAQQGTPYSFLNLSETLQNLTDARNRSNQALDALFRLEQTGATANQIQAAERAAARYIGEADELQLMLTKLLKGTIED